MRLLRILPERWQRLIPEMTKFAVIGAINTAVDIVIYNALLSIGPLKAKAISTVIATTLSYFMNRHWTYASRQRGKAHQAYLLFFALNMIGFVIQMVPIGFTKYGLGFSEESPALADWVAFNLANIFGTFLGMVFRFWSYRTFVFRAAPGGGDATEPEPTPVSPDPTQREAVVSTHRAVGSNSAETDDEFVELTATLEAGYAEEFTTEQGDFATEDSVFTTEDGVFPAEGMMFSSEDDADPVLSAGESTRAPR